MKAVQSQATDVLKNGFSAKVFDLTQGQHTTMNVINSYSERERLVITEHYIKGVNYHPFNPTLVLFPNSYAASALAMQFTHQSQFNERYHILQIQLPMQQSKNPISFKSVFKSSVPLHPTQPSTLQPQNQSA
jgi:hypothetical protein